jgi:hypothetical protein
MLIIVVFDWFDSDDSSNCLEEKSWRELFYYFFKEREELGL